jgi:integrase/recombinase XerD
VARKVSALRQFFKFCCLEGLLEHNLGEGLSTPKQPHRLPDALSMEEIQALLDTATRGLDYKGSHRTAQQGRDRAMIYLLYATGLRVSELVGLELAQIDLPQSFVRVMGKGSKERIVPFPPVVGKLLESYLLQDRTVLKARTQHVFLNPRGLALTRQGFWKTLNHIALKSGLGRRISPHKIRHAFATHLLQSGMNLRSLQMLLGHSDLSTTQIYTHVSPEHLKNTHKKHHPRG